MIIYEFSTWGTKRDELFSITEIEVEEKPKTYIGKHTRISKEDIGKLQSHFGDRMYLLNDNPKPYIEAITKRCEDKVNILEIRLAEAKKRLAFWEALKNEQYKK